MVCAVRVSISCPEWTSHSLTVRSQLPLARMAPSGENDRPSTLFVCPSVYEPLGIVNLEAMACGTAVVASDVGGIPEVVDHGRTGLLVHYDESDTSKYRTELADAINEVLADPARAAAFGAAGRQRAVDEFSWATVAEQTVEVYRGAVHS